MNLVVSHFERLAASTVEGRKDEDVRRREDRYRVDVRTVVEPRDRRRTNATDQRGERQTEERRG